MEDLHRHVKSFFADLEHVPRKVHCAFSGGADSTALLLIMNDIAHESNFELSAVHFEHGLRGRESLEDAEWCRNLCEIRRIPFTHITLEVKNRMLPGESIESAARRLRQRRLSSMLADDEAVALAHHADDKMENLFLRLMRGSNCSGLSSPHPVNRIDGVKVLRPLLSRRKNELETLLREKNIEWRTDRTNSDMSIKRNAVRHGIIPAFRKHFENFDSALTTSINALEQDADFLDETAETIFSENLADKNRLSLSRYTGLHPALKPRILRLWLSSLAGKDVVPQNAFLKRLDTEIGRIQKSDDFSAREIPLRKGISVCMDKTDISLKTDAAQTPGQRTWSWRKNQALDFGAFGLEARMVEKPDPCNLKCPDGKTAFFDAEDFPETLLVRCRNEGDRMRPFASENDVRIKKIFSNSRLDPDKRDSLPLVCTPENKIIWIPGVRRSDFAPVLNDTENILRLRISGL